MTFQSECGRLRSALAAQARTSEERLTELHGVIAELRRAGVARDRSAIPELREDESELETSCREGSLTGGAVSDHTTSPGEVDETASIPQEHEPSPSPVSPAALPIPEFATHANDLQQSKTNIDPRTPVNPTPDTTSLEDETLELDRRFQSDRRRRKPNSRSPRLVRREVRRKGDGEIDGDAEDEVDFDEPQRLAESLGHYSPRLGNRLDPRHQLGQCLRGSPVSSLSPQTKLASRVRLRKTHEDNRLTGKDICQEGVSCIDIFNVFIVLNKKNVFLFRFLAVQ